VQASTQKGWFSLWIHRGLWRGGWFSLWIHRGSWRGGWFSLWIHRGSWRGGWFSLWIHKVLWRGNWFSLWIHRVLWSGKGQLGPFWCSVARCCDSGGHARLAACTLAKGDHSLLWAGESPLLKGLYLQETLWIHRVFDHAAQNPYEFIGFLTMLLRIPMKSYGFWAIFVIRYNIWIIETHKINKINNINKQYYPSPLLKGLYLQLLLYIF